jgi:uncharacterized damage-inducible protein DinB
MLDQIVQAWQINHRVNMRLIDAISDAGMRSTLSTRGGRDVARQFAHMHDVRCWWLESHFRELSKDLTKFASKRTPSKTEIRKAHAISTALIEEMFRRAIDGRGTIKGVKQLGVVSVLGYFISHESHHRGSILLTLKQTGHKLPQTAQYGIWDWARI